MPHHLSPGWDPTDLPMPDDVRPAWSPNAVGALVDAATEALSLMRWEGWEDENARPDQRQCVAALVKALEDAS